MGERDEVLFANEAFYEAFARADVAAMDAVWATDRDDVTVVHPGMAPIAGRSGVMATWQAIFEDASHVDIRCANAQAFLHGDVAIVLCTEIVDGHGLSATNVFRRGDPGWRLVHHHAGPCHAPERMGEPKQVVLH